MKEFDSFAQMQRDAAMRVMEMQKRAQAAIRHSEEPPGIPATIDTTDDPLMEPASSADIAPAESKEQNVCTDDEAEKALITAILLLLMREKADERLIFALLYILM
jgi:hypothetical protein